MSPKHTLKTLHIPDSLDGEVPGIAGLPVGGAREVPKVYSPLSFPLLPCQAGRLSLDSSQVVTTENYVGLLGFYNLP